MNNVWVIMLQTEEAVDAIACFTSYEKANKFFDKCCKKADNNYEKYGDCYVELYWMSRVKLNCSK